MRRRENEREEEEKVLIFEEGARDDEAHDLVGALEDLVNADVSQIPLNLVILEVSVASKHLKGIVADLEARVGGKPLCHGAVNGFVGVGLVDHPGGLSHHQTRAGEFRRHVGHLELQILHCIASHHDRGQKVRI